MQKVQKRPRAAAIPRHRLDQIMHVFGVIVESVVDDGDQVVITGRHDPTFKSVAVVQEHNLTVDLGDPQTRRQLGVA